jgi:hypothetical protein
MKAIKKLFHYGAIGVFTVVMLCAVTVGAEEPEAVPGVLYDNYENAMIMVSEVGMFMGNQWLVVGKVDLNSTPPDVGWGFAFYHPTNHDLCIHIDRDNAWYSHSFEGVWGTSGSEFVLSVSSLYNEITQLWTSPPSEPAATAAIAGDPSSR